MYSSRKVMLLAAIGAGLTVGGHWFGSSRAETALADAIASYPKANDIVDGSMVDIVLAFQVPVDRERPTLILRSSPGDRPLRPRLESATNYLFSVAGRLNHGAYELFWEARLSGGQSSNGTIRFIAKPSSPTSAPP
jgi:hypothetical protein